MYYYKKSSEKYVWTHFLSQFIVSKNWKMCKHTFYYLFSNIKYPAIYILLFVLCSWSLCSTLYTISLQISDWKVPSLNRRSWQCEFTIATRNWLFWVYTACRLQNLSCKDDHDISKCQNSPYVLDFLKLISKTSKNVLVVNLVSIGSYCTV